MAFGRATYRDFQREWMAEENYMNRHWCHRVKRQLLTIVIKQWDWHSIYGPSKTCGKLTRVTSFQRPGHSWRRYGPERSYLRSGVALFDWMVRYRSQQLGNSQRVTCRRDRKDDLQHDLTDILGKERIPADWCGPPKPDSHWHDSYLSQHK